MAQVLFDDPRSGLKISKSTKHGHNFYTLTTKGGMRITLNANEMASFCQFGWILAQHVFTSHNSEPDAFIIILDDPRKD